MAKLITLTEYAKRKKVSLKTVYNWINAGTLEPTLVGKHKFITIKNERTKTKKA